MLEETAARMAQVGTQVTPETAVCVVSSSPCLLVAGGQADHLTQTIHNTKLTVFMTRHDHVEAVRAQVDGREQLLGGPVATHASQTGKSLTLEPARITLALQQPLVEVQSLVYLGDFAFQLIEGLDSPSLLLAPDAECSRAKPDCSDRTNDCRRSKRKRDEWARIHGFT